MKVQELMEPYIRFDNQKAIQKIGNLLASNPDLLSPDLQEFQYAATLPAVSVITVCYNASSSIERTIRSVISQNYPEMEYIIIDGNSSDDTMEYVSKYMDAIDIIVSEPDNGLYDAMNKGVARASGEYLLFINAGDILHDENSIALLANAARQSGAAVVGGQTYTLDEKGSLAYVHENFSSRLCLLRGMPFCHQATLYKKSLHDIFGLYDVKYAVNADYDFILKLYRNNVKFLELPQFVADFQQGGISTSRNDILCENLVAIRSRIFRHIQPQDYQILHSPFLYSYDTLLSLYRKYAGKDPLFDECMIQLILFMMYGLRIPGRQKRFCYKDAISFDGLGKFLRQQPAAILGNGPSLRGFDFAANLKAYATFGMNAAYRYWHKIKWYPDYYSCLDLVVGISHKEAILDLIKRRKELGIKRFLLRHNLVLALGEWGKDPSIDDFDKFLGSHDPYFNPDCVTTGSHTLAWAAKLGYKDIILLGMDSNYVNIIPEAKKDGAIGLIISKTPEHNPNYFFDDYQQAGDKYNVPNPEGMQPMHVISWEVTRDILNKFNVHVVNGNLASKLDVFPKISFYEGLHLLIAERLKETNPDIHDQIICMPAEDKAPPPALPVFSIEPEKQKFISARRSEHILAELPPYKWDTKLNLCMALSIHSIISFDINLYIYQRGEIVKILNLAQLYIQRQQWNNYLVVLPINPANSSLYVALKSRIYYQFEFKIRYFNIFLKRNPGDKSCSFHTPGDINSANAYYDRGDYLSALTLNLECHSIYPLNIYRDNAFLCARKMKFHGVCSPDLIPVPEKEIIYINRTSENGAYTGNPRFPDYLPPLPPAKKA